MRTRKKRIECSCSFQCRFVEFWTRMLMKFHGKEEHVIIVLNHQNLYKQSKEEEYFHWSVRSLDFHCRKHIPNSIDLNLWTIWNINFRNYLLLILARINHDCTPNCRKYFSVDQSTDGGNRITMVVKASRDISAGEELNISYTPPMLNTQVRQMILTQTKVNDCLLT